MDTFISLLSADHLFTLLMLILLQAVLGFDNLLYISIESKRVPRQSQAMVRRLGIGLAIVLRIVLLFVILRAVNVFQDPWFEISGLPGNFIVAQFNVHALLVLFGGAFIIYTALKEIYHMLSLDQVEDRGFKAERSVASAIAWIVVMNAIFSFDSILSAIALTDNFWIMAIAILVSGVLMIWLADNVAEFLNRNRMYEVLGLFILFIVGIMLLSEGGHVAHLRLFDHPVEPMAKSTFYFVIFVLVVVEIAQGRYQRKLFGGRRQGTAATEETKDR